MKIHATSILVEEGSSINADGRGWSGGLGNAPGKNGSGIGGGKGGTEYKKEEDWGKGGKGGGGGGGGGDGGNGGGTSNESWYSFGGTASYFSDLMGAGGGGGGDYKDTGGQTEFSSGGNGGCGGGYVWLEAYNIMLAGCISANGTDGKGWDAYPDKNPKGFKGGGGGGGAGGGIIIKGDTVNVTSMLYVRGGKGGSTEKGHGGGGGGGGVIDVSFEHIYPTDKISINETLLDVSNGTGGTTNATTQMENGKDGFLGLKSVEPAKFTAHISHYTSGYLVSNMTNVLNSHGGDVGYDTTSTHICYGNLSYGPMPRPGTDIVLKVRTSMYPNMNDALAWEACPPVANGTDISDLVSVSDGHRYIQWRAELLTYDPGITPILSGVNISYVYGDPVLAHSSGTIGYKSQYLYYPNYQLVYAHGATIREQDDGGVIMLFPPPLFIDTQETGTALKMRTINMTGDAYAVSGRVSATVQTSPRGATLLKPGMNYANVTLKLITAYPGLWERWFNETCRNAGLSYGTPPGEYALNRTDNTLLIAFYGNESNPVNVKLKQAGAKVKLVK